MAATVSNAVAPLSVCVGLCAPKRTLLVHKYFHTIVAVTNSTKSVHEWLLC